MIRRTLSSCVLCACVAAMAMPQGAIGQQSGGATDGAETALQEIVVTANKREQNLNDVGAAISVVSGEALKNQHIDSQADLANAVPGLSFTYTPNGNPVYTLRGVGFYDSSLAAYPAVTIYVDEMPFSFMALAKHSLYDIDRVEVLKGPQGTLFGQNATGGAINYIAAKPSRTFDVGGDVTYGRFNEIQTEGFVTGPVTDTLQFRLSARTEYAGGWQQSNSRPGDTNGKTNDYMARFQLAFEPSDSARFLLNINGWKDLSQTQAPQAIAFNIQNPVVFPELTAAQLSPQTSRAADWIPGVPFSDNRMWQASLRADIDLNDAITLTSLSSYVNYTQRQGEDDSGLPIYDTELPLDLGSIESVFQELRLSNPGGRQTRWVVGANYENSSVDELVDDNYSASSSTATLGTFLGYPIGYSVYNTSQHMRNAAGFGNIEQDVADGLTLKAGARYTASRATSYACNASPASDPTTGQFFYNVLLAGAYGPYVPGDCFQINDQKETIGGVAPGTPGALNDVLKEDNLSWRIGADWKIQPGLLAYLNVAKGFKSGGFPTVSSSTFESYIPIRQESVLSYETGVKSTTFDGRLQTNASIYYYDYNDKQMQTKVNEPPFGILDALQNVPKSKVEGAELSVTTRPVRSLTLSADVTYSYAVIKEFTGINAAGVEANFAGTQVPYTPRWQGGISAQYEFPHVGGVVPFAGGDVNVRSRTYSVIGGNMDPPTAQPQTPNLFGIDGYTLVNLQTGFTTDDGHWRASLWGKNVFNRYYWNNVSAIFDTVTRYTGMPGTFGVTVGYRYK